MSTRIVIPARISYEHVWEPKAIRDSDPKYSVSLIIPKSDTKTIEKIEKAIQEAITEGVAKKYEGKRPKDAALKLPLRDGDLERDEDAAYVDSMFLNASSKDKPGIVNRRTEPILDRDEVYSGCYCNVSVNFYPFNFQGKKGVAAGLGNIQKVKDGEPLSGRTIMAADEFTDLGDGDDDRGGFGSEDADDLLG